MSTTIAEPRTSGHGCNCGCSDCKGECCELECLVQPRFFCGQLLTDQDLSVLLDWVKGKTALARYRHGWGVVCGLEVDCGAESGGEGHVSVLPGYAVDCCGNDIIVCEKATIDLSKFCKPEQDPCADWPPPPQPPPDNTTLNLGGWEIPMSEVQAVDLFVRYSETASDARTALARGGCDASEACEYTRTHEGYTLYAKKVADPCSPHSGEQRAEKWETEYRDGLTKLYETLKSLYNPVDSRGTAERLSQWLRNNPLHSFCFVREWLCEIQRENNPPQGWFTKMVFPLVQDWRNHHFSCDCYGCGPESGVPLAKVWLWRQRDANGKYRCKVIYINSYPPFRRPLQQECWPSPRGSANLARFIWQPTDYVVAELRKLNFDNIAYRVFNYNSLDDLYGQLQSEMLVPNLALTGSLTLVMHAITDNCGQSRVVYFSVGDNSSSLGAPVMTVAKPETENFSRSAPASTDDTAASAVAPEADHPSLDLKKVPGIGEVAASKLKEYGISNLRTLADADATTVKEALSTLHINRPDDVRSQAYIDEAKKQLDDLQAS